MSATNVQTAIDELYNTCFPPKTGGEAILEKVPIVNLGDGLYKDEYEDRYFYRGKNPNNYIMFNNENWRILSIESDGTIKIIRNEKIGNIEWDTSGAPESNNWMRPASLNTYLNGTYLNGLTSTAQSQIVAKDWSIGAVTDDNNNLSNQIEKENSIVWNGKIALPTLSEYIRSNSNKSSCGTHELHKDNYSTCGESTWMTINTFWWTLTKNSDFSSTVFRIIMNDNFYDYDVANLLNNMVRPTLYLSSDIKITNGDGSQNNPYTLSL